MLNESDIKKHMVMVNEGSGCLVRPMDSAGIMYILTARHVIEKDRDLLDDLVIKRYCDVSKDYVSIAYGAPNTGINYFPHPNQDAAVLKIDIIADLDLLMPFNEGGGFVDGYLLSGYPSIRRTDNDPYRLNDVKLLDIKLGDIREAEIANNASQDEVNGQSGAGIVRLEGNVMLLAGVQSAMANEAEQMGRIQVIPMAVFEEIVRDNGLPELIPHYLDSFVHFKNEAMPLKNVLRESDVILTRNYLQDITYSIVESGLRPKDILDKLGPKLLIATSPESDLIERQLWSSWLEFLILLNVRYDMPFDWANIEARLKSVRLLFANIRGDWIHHLESILRSDFTGLGNNDVVIISTLERPDELELLNEYVRDVARSIPKSEQEIDNGSDVSLAALRFVHIYAFQRRAILDHLNEYKDFEIDQYPELREKLKRDFGELLDERRH